MDARAEILAKLQDHRPELRALGAKRLGIFGSVARGEERPDSDLDVLVDLDERSFDRYMDLKLYLQDLLGKNIDLVLADGIRPELRDEIVGALIDAL